MRTTSPLAGKLTPASLLIDVDRLLAAYQDERPDPADPAQRVVFGVSGHRGSSLRRTFNAWHVLAIAQAICDYRKANGVDGPLYLGIDTHALSVPACASVLEVLAANGVETMLAAGDAYTPTPAVSYAILTYNKWRTGGFADGIVITPSDNPPQDGGIKYNPLHGGPAGTDATRWIEEQANAFLERKLDGVRRIRHVDALKAATTHRHDFLGAYVADLGNVVDLDLVGNAGLALGVDPLGGAGVHYWPAIAERYRLDLTVVSDAVDPTFRFMTVDGDGQIRMDPSSRFAMQRLIDIKDRFDIAFACDTDHDRHGVVTRGKGLLPPNHYLTVVADYLFRHRPDWSASLGVGKSIVTTSMMDRVCQRLGRAVREMPVGFKWFVPGLQDGTLGVACEESAGATFVRRDGAVWTTDKDGIVAALLAAEITAATGHDPGALYAELADEFGDAVADRLEAPADREQMIRLARLSPADVTETTLAGERIEQVVDTASGNGEAIGGIKVTTHDGWFVARPSGTEPLYEIYAESLEGVEHLQRIVDEARKIVDGAIAARPGP